MRVKNQTFPVTLQRERMTGKGNGGGEQKVSGQGAGATLLVDADQ